MTREEKKNALHCLKVMIDEEVCEECDLYGTTGTDHCEADCVRVAIKALEQEPCEDAISREDAIKRCWFGMTSFLIADNLRKLPPVTPQPKTGHWIKISPAEIYECSECGQNVMTSDICAYKFCHGCGSKMVEPQESEVSDEDSD